MTAITQYWAKFGIDVDNSELKKVDAFLKKVEEKITGKSNALFKIKLGVNKTFLSSSLKEAVDGINTKPRKIKLKADVSMDKDWASALKGKLESQKFRINVTPFVSLGDMRRALRTMQKAGSVSQKATVSGGALIPSQSPQNKRQIYGPPKPANLVPPPIPKPKKPRSSRSGYVPSNMTPEERVAWEENKRWREETRRYRAIWGKNPIREDRSQGQWLPRSKGNRQRSISGSGDPTAAEWIGQGMRTAGNRRFLDAITEKGTRGFLGEGFGGRMAQFGTSGIARLGASSIVGRLGIAAGTIAGGPVGGVAAGIVSSIIPAFQTAGKLAWGSFMTVVSAPFKILNSSITLASRGFMQLARVMVPLTGLMHYITSNVQQTTSRNVALQTTSSRFGSSAERESKWLMEMADREGLSYKAMIDPFTSFLGASSSSIGIDASRSMFEAISQYGSVHGADTVSTGRALLALSQIPFQSCLLF